jgi:hypothetical protein
MIESGAMTTTIVEINYGLVTFGKIEVCALAGFVRREI